MAASAQAQAAWSPDNTSVWGSGQDTMVTYEGTAITCDASFLSGTTGISSPVLDLELGFLGDCDSAGFTGTVTCGDGTMRLTALDPESNTGTIDLNPGFFCEIALPGVCSVSIDGPQADVGAFVLDETFGILTIEVDAAATRSGSSLCGPASGRAGITEDYDVGSLQIVEPLPFRKKGGGRHPAAPSE